MKKMNNDKRVVAQFCDKQTKMCFSQNNEGAMASQHVLDSQSQ